MLRFVLRGSASVLFLFIALSCFSQTKWPHTLLWRISGKGLEKPSYLYGTMHLQDKRLFQFGDSLYHALEKTDGFAMEIDVSEMMDSIMTNALKEAEKEHFLERQKVRLNRKKLDRSTDSLLRSFGIKGDVATKKDLKKIRDRRTSKLLQQGEMPTIVDAYLLGLAKRMDKWTGGIEDVNDQLDLSDEIGGALDPESVLVPETVFKTSIEQMIAVYLAQDLDKLEEISNRGYSAKDLDLILTNRNIKMAYRMDSLAHVRPMFFAVGAAHLPGDSGVITLLKKDGYNVEPVFSSAKIDANSYAAKLREQSWVTIEGENKSYTVQMPGKASDYNMLGELVKMKMYFDMTTMSFYFSGSIIGGQLDQKKLDEMMKAMISNMGGKKASVKYKILEGNGLSGKEATAETDESSYRMQVFAKDQTLFLLMMGAMKKASIYSADADRFFTSFVPGHTVVEKKNWEAFSLKGKAFSVNMPGTPSPNAEMDKQMAGNSNWVTSSHQAIDPIKGAYYLVQVREMKEGYYLDGDSAYFELLKTDFESRLDEMLSTRVTTYRGYPALYMDAYHKGADAVYKTLHVVRGNRDYMLMAGMPKGQDMTDADTFLQSFQLLPYDSVAYTYQHQNGFSAKTPGRFKKIPADSTEARTRFYEHYNVRNPIDAVSYDVFVETFSPFYWTANDSTFFNNKVSQYKASEDSIIKKEWVQNGGVRGIEVVVKIPGYNSLRNVRMLVNGDTLYTLFSMIPSQEINAANHRTFFNEFRLVKETPPAIYTRKVQPLLTALQSQDSTVFEDAKEQLSNVEFQKEDLPALHQALLKAYADTNMYNTVKDKLIDITSKLADNSTITFVEKNYSSKLEDASAQYALLAVLAKMKTDQSYNLLKELLLTQLPSAGDPGMLHGGLYDSLSLTAKLFPAILQHSADSLLGHTIVIHANNLLDSNLLMIKDLAPYHDQVLKGASQAAAWAKADEEKIWALPDWAFLLGQYNSEKGNAVIRQMLTVKDTYVKQAVILALLKNNQPVGTAEITKVAADKLQRIYFYNELKKLKKERLFPAIYASQKSLAESELHNFVGDEYTDDFTLTYIGERIEEYEGKKKIFHLFKLRMVYDDEEKMQTFLAVAGPYDINAKEKITSSNASGFYTGEEFNPSKIGKLLKAFLQEIKPAEE